MKTKKHSASAYLKGFFTLLYLMGFLFLCTVVYFNRFQFNQPSDSKQYMLPFIIMFLSWGVICLTEFFDLVVVRESYYSFRHFFTQHILFILFLGGNYLWSKGAKLFLLNHIIIFLIGIGTFYRCIQYMLVYLTTTDSDSIVHVSSDRKQTS